MTTTDGQDEPKPPRPRRPGRVPPRPIGYASPHVPGGAGGRPIQRPPGEVRRFLGVVLIATAVFATVLALGYSCFFSICGKSIK